MIMKSLIRYAELTRAYRADLACIVGLMTLLRGCELHADAPLALEASGGTPLLGPEDMSMNRPGTRPSGLPVGRPLGAAAGGQPGRAERRGAAD